MNLLGRCQHGVKSDEPFSSGDEVRAPQAFGIGGNAGRMPVGKLKTPKTKRK